MNVIRVIRVRTCFIFIFSVLFSTPILALDIDGDGVADGLDNCLLASNPVQRDTDDDGYGNYCDPDFDGDLVVNASDLSYMKSNFFTTDSHSDLNGDGIVNAGDLSILKSFFFKSPGPSGIAPGVETDTTSPAQINLNAFAIDLGTPGQLTVSGLIGSVEANATIEIDNVTKGEVNSVSADANGAFGLIINGDVGDILIITVKDAAGNASEPVQYIIGAIQIINPVANGAINDDTVNVHGTFSGTPNSGIFVNGVAACVKGNEFYINNVPIQIGNNSISAVLTQNDNIKSSSLVEINSTGSNDVHFSATQNCSIAPLATSFDLSAQSISPTQVEISQVDIDFDGDGVVNVTSYWSMPDSSLLTYTYDEGVYTANVTIYSRQGASYTEDVFIVVQDPAQLDSVFEFIWQGMNSALLSGNVEESLLYIHPDSHYLYEPLFNALLPHMSEINSGFSDISRLSHGNSVSSYLILKVVDNNAKTHIINYRRDSDAVWKIDSL